MLNIPNDVKALFQQDGVHKNFHVTFPNGETTDLNNENIIQESVKFTESLCSQTYFKFGLAEASQIEFTAVGIPNILGVTMYCAIEIDCTSLGAEWAADNPVDPTLPWLEPQTCMVDSKLYYRVPYGEFIVDSCPRDHGAMFQRKIVAYSDLGVAANKQAIPGQLPVPSVSLSVVHWALAQMLKKSDMSRHSYVPSTWSASSTVNTELKNMYDDYLTGHYTYFYGVEIAFSNVGLTRGKKYAVRFDYVPHEFDSYGGSLSDAAIDALLDVNLFGYARSQMPLGGGNYQYIGVKQYNTTKKAGFHNLRGIAPCFWLECYYEKEDYSDLPKYITKPVFIKPGETYIVDTTISSNLPPVYDKIPDDPLDSPTAPVYGATLSNTVRLYCALPVVWKKSSAYWLYSNGSKTYATDWGTAAPFDDDEIVVRDMVAETAGASVYTKELDTAEYPITLNIDVKNTLEINKGDPLGKYYTYANAVSVNDMLSGSMELLGAFCRKTRTGETEVFNISDNQAATPVSRSAWEEFWWDENDVEPIGTVNVKIKRSGDSEEQMEAYTIGTGKSIYTMDNNSVMSNTEESSTTIRNAILSYFAPNASVVNFTPVDLTMKGLPYMEAGDKIELVADDNSVVQSYILEQTITGIQHLKTEVTSTNGELLEVVEE